MRSIGQVFQLKEKLAEIKSELTPSFHEIIKSYLGEHVKTRFRDPSYVVEITWLTPSLETFLKNIFEGLEIPIVQGTFLVRGFGFGKTHAIILLWHMLNSSEGAKSSLAKSLGLKEELAKETLTIGVDFSKEEPFTQILRQLEAIAEGRKEWSIKDPGLRKSVIETIRKVSKARMASISSRDLTSIITETLENYRKLGGSPRLLLLIDELGIGMIRRLINYIETQNEESYLEIERTINFIDEVYASLSGRGIPTFIIIALAEQDLREIDSIYLQQAGKQIIRDKIDGLRKRLSILRERLSRAVGGFSEETALTYDLRHAINIARHRVLRKQIDGKPEEELLSYLALQAQQYNLQETLETYKEQIKDYYPLSPSFVWLFRKILDPIDAPRTEYIRTALYMFAEAAENALIHEPESLSIGARHISLARAGAIDLMAEFEADWASALSDIEHALRIVSSEIQKAANIVAKQILAKGTTANVTALIEVKDSKELKRYGVTPEEMQLDILAVLPPEEAMKVIENIQKAIEALKAQSARIEEKENGKQRFYMPSLMRTIYDKLAAFVMEQRRVLEETAYIPVYLQQVNIPGLFHNPRAAIKSRENEVIILLRRYSMLENIEDLLNDADLRDSQSKGLLSIIVIPPWDTFLFNELYQRKTSYRTITDTIAQKLQSANIDGRIKHPFHIIVLLPNISPEKMSRLIDDAISYAAVKNFLEYLENKEKILEEKMIDYERTVQKRLTLRLAEFFEEQRKRLEAGLKNSLERQIREARMSAQRELIRLTRRIATNIVELYEETIFCSMQMQNFVSQSLAKLLGEIGSRAEKLEKDSLVDYSLILNTFFGKIVELAGFVWDAGVLGEALYRHYRTEVESGVLRERDRIDEVVENMLLGTYGMKPLSSQVAKEAINVLHGKTIEIEGKKITLLVDEEQGWIRFKVEETKLSEKPKMTTEELVPKIEEITAPTTVITERTLNEVTIEVDQTFNYEDFKARLGTLYKTYGTLISSVKLRANGELLRAIFDFLGSVHEPSTIVNVSYFLRQLATKYKLMLYIEIKFASSLPQEKIQEILGPFITTKVKRSWDKLLLS
ncbi:MAG: hypothetical protein QW143_05945 [Candidatus Korarchaeota archaeon]